MEVEIDAGDLPRDQSVVVIRQEKGSKSSLGHLTAKDGTKFPCQRNPNGILTFLSPPMKAGEKLILKLSMDAEANDPAMLARNADDQVKLSVRGNDIAIYQAAARKSPRPGLDPRFLRGGYLHPLLSPSGKAVTDDYAINHLHHHGIWTAWTKTSFDGREPDFWNMGQGKGKVDFVSLDQTWNGDIAAGLSARHRYTDLTGATPTGVLTETWTVNAYAVDDDFRLLDLEATQTCATDKPLLLPIYHYGGLGIRGREEWNGKDKAAFITSEKVDDRQKANGQPARWIAIAGAVEGGTAGLAVLSHPENFRSPQPVRIHPNEPFISFAPQTNEAMSIQPGETYRMQYRFVTFDGEPDPAKLEALWQDYANPIKASIRD
jgi:hypothetical protein